MVERNLDVPCEAVISCPICNKKAKIRDTKVHIETVHEERVTYECTILTNGSKCEFFCGERLGCFNNHQTRKHGQEFPLKLKHTWGEYRIPPESWGGRV